MVDNNGRICRDYSLIGRDTHLAEADGLANADWYLCAIPRTELKKLLKRSDGPAIRDTLIWISALVVTGFGGAWFWGSWACIPFFIVYGVLYGSASDSRWHECGHGTAFKTRWLNDAVYHIACFMILREPTIWRWSHARHHTDTIIVGRDPEIVAHRPPDIFSMILNLFAIKSTFHAFGKLFLHASGKLDAEEATFVPEMERTKVYWIARLYLLLFAGIVVGSIALGSILPAMLIGLPTLYGAWLAQIFGLTQHAGLGENVLDHRQNSRTVMMNPVFRFLYWNMNYHVEHHMFPMVPYHALPKLHEAIKADCPAPYPSLLAAYREIIPTLLRQCRDPDYFVQRGLPDHMVRKSSTEGLHLTLAE
ncbi:fatty acid desaturase family protein [Beijerinckia indica]|uniref:Fatty acid desaturase n=1 Tax=Beijerinckia indica subsp. indica (strain ATCC 9039 / DSM 1715 / NCIMB 8712) TaxID=395963 RepID=B2IJW4_BEII9|nr:fatty acid desaturase family protein [Beijerinckia indica]ACB96339.1 fatty acid desaturase [Beijerinckia indica subsp. indica ATCC 9039]